MNAIKNLIRSMRPYQWVKNIFIFAGLIFSERFTNLDSIVISIIAFISFCFLSSSVYLINDIKDKNEDRIHSEKRNRPIASGLISIELAIYCSLILLITGLTIGFFLNINFAIVGIIYFLINLGYSFKLKSIVILDVMIVALGFVLRAVAGAVVLSVEISPWLILCTFLLALFLGFAKRRGEIIELQSKAENHRISLQSYSIHFIDQMLAITASASVIGYSLYTMWSETIQKFNTHFLIYTTIFVIYGIFRYYFLIYQKTTTSNPTKIVINDKPLQISVILWILSVIIIITLKP